MEARSHTLTQITNTHRKPPPQQFFHHVRYTAEP